MFWWQRVLILQYLEAFWGIQRHGQPQDQWWDGLDGGRLTRKGKAIGMFFHMEAQAILQHVLGWWTTIAQTQAVLSLFCQTQEQTSSSNNNFGHQPIYGDHLQVSTRWLLTGLQWLSHRLFQSIISTWTKVGTSWWRKRAILIICLLFWDSAKSPSQQISS